MLHPWNKTLRVQISAQDVRAVLFPGWWQRRRSAHKLADKSRPAPDNYRFAKAMLTQPLAQALESVFDGVLPQGRASHLGVHVTVADSYAHYDVIAGDYAGYSNPQLQAIAMGCVSELLGEAAACHLVRWHLQPDLHHLLLCAIDQQLVQAIVEAAAINQLPLESLQPAFCRHWNGNGLATRAGNTVFAMADAGHSLVTYSQHGCVTALSYGAALSAGASPTEWSGKTALDLRTDRLLASIGQSAQSVGQFVVVARHPRLLAPTPRWTVLDWQEERI